MTYVPYTNEVEQIAKDEDEIVEKIIAAMTRESETTERHYGHAIRVSHAKATGFLVGELHVAEGLPPELRQGLFAVPKSFTALARLAQGPGELLKDSVSTHRGMAIKVIGVEGAKIPEDEERETQDFVLETGKMFTQANSAAFLQTLRGISNAPHLPDGVKEAVSTLARAAHGALEAVGVKSRKLDFFGHTKRHPLAESYFSQVPIRFGDYVAKIGVFPASPSQEALQDIEIDTTDDPDAFRHAVVEYSRNNASRSELRVQLATDLKIMPVEDGTVEWPEDQSPYVTVARLGFPAQEAFSEARRDYFDNRLSFKPAHSLVEHRPLGSIMRARLKVYLAMAKRRQTRVGSMAVEPRVAADIPA